MDKIALIKSAIEDKKELLSQTEDGTKQAEISAEIEELYIELGAEKARAEQEGKLAKEKEEEEKKAHEDAKEKSSVNKMEFRGGEAKEIKVTSPGEYKGFYIERELDTVKEHFGGGHPVVQRMNSRPEKAEKVVKHFIDLTVEAMKSPLAGAFNRKAALQEDTDSEGGYLTPTEERMEVLSYIREESVAMADTTHIRMTSDSMTLPRELTKVTMAFTDEESEATETEPTFDQVTLTAKRLDAYSVTSNELIDDAGNPGGIAGLLLSQFIEAYGQKIDSAVFQGTGNPVSSVLSAGGAGYSQVLGSGSAAFSSISEADLRKIVGKIPTRRLSNAKWYMHRTVLYDNVFGIKDGNDRNIFLESNVAGVPGMLMGYPTRLPEEIVSTSAASTGFILFGNLKGFYIGDRLTRIRLMVDPYSLSTKNQTIFLMFTRWAFAHGLPNMYGRIVTNS